MVNNLKVFSFHFILFLSVLHTISTLSATTAFLTQNTKQVGINQDYSWEIDSRHDDRWQQDDFGNSFYYDHNGNYHFIDNFGESWYHNETSDEWFGENDASESWYYNAYGYQEYWDSEQNHWVEDSTETEYYYDYDTGDVTITQKNGDQEYYKLLESAKYDKYNYKKNGDMSFLGGDSKDEWYYEAAANIWTYYSASADTWFGSDIQTGWLIDSEGNKITYERPKDQFIFQDTKALQFYYYPEWAWGNSHQEWYLRDEMHDNWILNS